MNNETSGKPVPMKFKPSPLGGPESNATKHGGSGGASGETKYMLKNPEAYYRVSGGPTLGTPQGGPDELASVKNPKTLKKFTLSNRGNGGRNGGDSAL